MTKLTQSLKDANTLISKTIISIFVSQCVSLTETNGSRFYGSIYLNPRGEYMVMSVLGIDINCNKNGLKINSISVEIMNIHDKHDTREIMLTPKDITQFDREI